MNELFLDFLALCICNGLSLECIYQETEYAKIQFHSCFFVFTIILIAMRQ